MAPLAALPSDAWVDILSLLSSLGDLHNAILSCSQVLNAFYERRTALISTVLRAEIFASDEDNVYKHAEAVAARLRHKPLADAIIVHKAIEPLLKDTVCDPRYYKWCLSLCRLYSKRGASCENKRRALLQRAYQDILTGYKANFELATNDPNVTTQLGSNRLPKYCYAVADRLSDDYTRLGQLRGRLLVEQEILRRSALKEIDSLEWGNRVVNTLRAIQDDNEDKSIEEAVQFENNMYETCRQRGMLDRSLFWARHLIREYIRANHTDEAISEQERILLHLRRGSNEYIAWARQLIIMYRRAGHIDDSLALKAAVWNSMNTETSTYFGWARELADQYRYYSRPDDALKVIQTMHSETRQKLMRQPRDLTTKFHATQAAYSFHAYQIQE